LRWRPTILHAPVEGAIKYGHAYHCQIRGSAFILDLK